MCSNLLPSDLPRSVNQQQTADSSHLQWTLDPQLQELVSDGQGDLVKQLLEAFLQEASEHLQAARNALLDLRMDDVRFHAHSLKGGAGSIGAQSLYETARKVETAAKLDDQRSSSEGVAEMSNLFVSVRASVQDVLQHWNSQVVGG